MKAPVQDYTIIVAFHPRVSTQAQAETLSKSLNFTLTKLDSSEALNCISSYEEYKGVIQNAIGGGKPNQVNQVNHTQHHLGDQQIHVSLPESCLTANITSSNSNIVNSHSHQKCSGIVEGAILSQDM